jgi:hypothetical protein
LDLGFRGLIVLLHPGGSIRAEFLGVGFIEGSEEFEDGICGGIAFRFTKADKLGFQVIGQEWAVGPNLFNEV